MAKNAVTIRISRRTWERLQKRKSSPGMTFDKVIENLLDFTYGDGR